MTITPVAPHRNLKHAIIQQVEDQARLGFSPWWLLTFHYSNPYERGWRVVETPSRWGYKIPTRQMLWDNSGWDKSLQSRRNNLQLVSKDAQHIRNLLLQRGWGITGKLDKHRESVIPMVFVHEKGRSRLQYHTHLIIPALPAALNNTKGIDALWKQQILPRAKSLSRTNSLHAEPVYDIRGLIGYLTKESRPEDLCIDYQASRLITPSSAPRLII